MLTEQNKYKRSINNIQDILKFCKNPNNELRKFGLNGDNKKSHFRKSIGSINPTKPITVGNNKPNVTSTVVEGQERANHKYIKREKNVKTGKWDYYYKDSKGRLTKEMKDDDKTVLSPNSRFNSRSNKPQNSLVEKTKNNLERYNDVRKNEAKLTDSKEYQKNIDYIDKNTEGKVFNRYTEDDIKGQKLREVNKELMGKVKDVNKLKKLSEAEIDEQLADTYVVESKAQKNMYLQDVDEVALANGLERASTKFGAFAVKDKASILNKIQRNRIKGKANSKLTDTLRTTLVIKNENQAEKIINDLENQGYKIIENDNLYLDKTPGYKHIAIKLQKGERDPLVKELLLMRPKMLEAKFGLGHDLYDLDKNMILAFPKLETIKDLHGALTLFQNDLRNISTQFYTEAYNADKLESEADASLKDSMNLTEPIPTQEQTKRMSDSSSSKTWLKRFALDIRSSFNASIQPALAKVKNSFLDNPNDSAYTSAINSILSSIVSPYEHIYEKYSGSPLPDQSVKDYFKSLYNILKKGNKIKEYTLKSEGYFRGEKKKV